jgi:ubiquinone biosynthesis protein
VHELFFYSKLYKRISGVELVMFIKPRRFIGIKRFEEILGVISRHGFDFMLEIAGLKKRRLFTKKHESRPVEVRIILEELGGCFVKLGQFLSLRPDLIPKEYSEELAKLQDSVASFSYSEAKAVVEHELGESLKHLFKEFSHEPVASASIGQVYKATLLSGKIVAVKVMRPGVKAQVLADLEILEYLARLLKQHVKPGVFDPEEIFAEFKRYTESELDYLKEAKSIKSAHESIRHQGISVPRVYSELTTKSVLVMEFLDGVPLSRIIRSPGDYKRIDKRLVCRRLANSFLSQVFIEGFFHADPHPGNILVSGKGLGLLDFGIVGWVDDALNFSGGQGR